MPNGGTRGLFVVISNQGTSGAPCASQVVLVVNTLILALFALAKLY